MRSKGLARPPHQPVPLLGRWKRLSSVSSSVVSAFAQSGRVDGSPGRWQSGPSARGRPKPAAWRAAFSSSLDLEDTSPGPDARIGADRLAGVVAGEVKAVVKDEASNCNDSFPIRKGALERQSL